jgi:predicted TIM-barrel fold metal-dependent hydrolase
MSSQQDSNKQQGASGRWTRRHILGASGIGSGLLVAGTAGLAGHAERAQAGAFRRKPERKGNPVIDGHIHLWKLPRNQPPINDNATYPTGCCGSIPWLEVDRLMPDYDARVGGPKVDKVVLIESSVGVPPDKIIQSNLWMLQTAATDNKILSVVGNLDVTQSPSTFAAQVNQLSADKNWVGIRIGGIFQPNADHIFANIQPNVLTNLALLANRRLMIDTLGITGSVLRSIAGVVPGLTIVMDHLAGKATSFDVEDSWKADMYQAAAAPGVHIKVSDTHKLSAQSVTGAPAGLIQFQPVADPEPYEPTLEFLYRTFGEDRLIFGTNWPVSDAGGIYVDSIDLEISIVESFLANKSDGRDKVMYRNAQRVYGPHK